MLDIMDTFNHQQYNQRENHNAIPMTNISKKMHSNALNRILPNDPCRVCGFTKNTGRNFGVISCSTCKAFFRRNGRNISSLPPCRFGGQCSVNEQTRRQCPTCRLEKCFSVGMQKDLIRTDEERAARLQLVKANRLQRHDKFLDQKTNRRMSYDINKKLIQNDKSSLRTLSSNDCIHLTNIRSAYDHFCLYPILRGEEVREEYLNTQPIKCRLKEHSFINLLNIRLTSLTAFFRATIPSFSFEMSSDDRQWLIRTNLHYLFVFSSMDLMNINGNQLHFNSDKACHTVYLYVFGQDLLTRAEYLIKKLNHLIGSDPVISKIMQIILFLSPSLVTNYSPMRNSYQPSLETILHVIYSQEQYIQILWSYLLSRFEETAAHKLFISLIGQVLQQQKFGADIDQSLLERQPFGNLIYSTLTSFSLD